MPKRRWPGELIGDLPQVCKLAFIFHARILRIRFKTPHEPLGHDPINIGSAESVPNTDKRRRLLPPFEMDLEPGKSLTQKLEGVISELQCELKDLLAKQADAIEGLRGEVKALQGLRSDAKDSSGQQVEAIQALRGDVKDLLGTNLEVLLTTLDVMKDNGKAGSKSILIL